MAEEKGFGSTLLIVAGGVLLVVVADNKFSGDPRPGPSPSVAPRRVISAPSPPDDWLKRRAEREVGKLLKDPDSATYSDMVVRRAPALVVCGRVNSRNGFGGLAGTQRFISGTITALDEQLGADAMDKLWDRVC